MEFVVRQMCPGFEPQRGVVTGASGMRTSVRLCPWAETKERGGAAALPCARSGWAPATGWRPLPTTTTAAPRLPARRSLARRGGASGERAACPPQVAGSFGTAPDRCSSMPRVPVRWRLAPEETGQVEMFVVLRDDSAEMLSSATRAAAGRAPRAHATRHETVPSCRGRRLALCHTGSTTGNPKASSSRTAGGAARARAARVVDFHAVREDVVMPIRAPPRARLGAPVCGAGRR